MENRLIDLETRMAYQEHTLQEMSDEVARQQQELLQLRHALLALQAQVRALSGGPSDEQADEPPPPHY